MRFLILALIFLSGCDGISSSDRIMNQQQEQLSKNAAQQVGMPAVVNFQEKRMLKMIIELRDTALSTITYTQDMNGKLHKICDSVGYGFPYATQFTSPQKDIFLSTPSSAHMAMPQADPNGLFSPPTADGTWVMCLDPKTKKVMPLYIEPHVIVSPFELNVI